MKKICLTGGGTAGHIMPNIAIFEEAKNEFEFFYIGAKNSMEEKLITPLMPFYSAPMVKLVRAFTFKNLKIPFVLIKSIIECKIILQREKPNLIFSKGGFVSVPVCLAGFLLKIPIITHESDLTLGLGNKIISKIAKQVCTSFEQTATGIKKGEYTGAPIRSCFKNANKNNAIELIKNYNPTKKTIIVVGGSLGSKNLNNAIIGCLKILQNFNVVHIVGKGNFNPNVKFSNYTQIEFAPNIADLFALSDIVITRGGSNALFELLHLNKKMIIVPLGKSQSRGDQLQNAQVFEKNGWATVLQEENLEATTLVETINQTLNKNFNTPKNINGTQNILAVIKKYAK